MSSLDSRQERVDDIERKLARRPEGWTTGELAREYGVDPLLHDTLLCERTEYIVMERFVRQSRPNRTVERLVEVFV